MKVAISVGTISSGPATKLEAMHSRANDRYATTCRDSGSRARPALPQERMATRTTAATMMVMGRQSTTPISQTKGRKANQERAIGPPSRAPSATWASSRACSSACTAGGTTRGGSASRRTTARPAST